MQKALTDSYAFCISRGMDSFSKIIALWPTVASFAEDVGAKYPTAASWEQRNTLPPDVWEKVVAAAARRGFEGVTFGRLAAIAAAKKAGKARAA